MKRTERKMRRAVCNWLRDKNLTPIFEVHFGTHLCDLVGVEFNDQRGKFIPSIRNIIAVELKLDDVASVLRQCSNCLFKVQAAYAAMPLERCLKMTAATAEKFLTNGVGLLAVSEKVRLMIPCLYHLEFAPQAMRIKLWRRRKEWIDRLREWELLNAE